MLLNLKHLPHIITLLLKMKLKPMMVQNILKTKVLFPIKRKLLFLDPVQIESVKELSLIIAVFMEFWQVQSVVMKQS